jgi:uncharacterized protein (DUF1499 family)
MKRKILVGVIAGVVLSVVLLSVTRTFYPTNIAETTETHSEEKLRTRRYATDLQTFAAETEKIAQTLSTWGANWKYIAAEKNENSVLLRAEVPVVVFTDDLQIKAEADGRGDGIVVNVRSNSRVGKSDFGENRRHVLKILAALDARFMRNKS